VTIIVLNPPWRTGGSVNVFLTGWKMSFVNPRHPQNMCCTLDCHLAKGLVTVTYGAVPFSAWAVSVKMCPFLYKCSPGEGNCATWLRGFHPFLSSTMYLNIEFWVIFLLLHRDLYYCPKNLLKKQVQIWEESISFLLYKFI